MNVYVENLFARASDFTASGLSPGCLAEYLYDDELSNGAEFAGNSTAVSASWGLNTFIDSIAVLDSNWTDGHLTVVSQGVTVFSRDTVSAGGSTVIRLPETVMASGLTFTLNAAGRLRIGILWAGKRLELPLFNTGFKYKYAVLSAAHLTRHGLVYGMKRPPLRSFDITFQDIDNTRREALERYIETVQYVKPHLAEPYESADFPPLWAVLTGAGEFGKRDAPGFRWDTALSYMEAK